VRRLLLCGTAAALLFAGYRRACAFEIVEDLAAEVGISKQVVEEIKNGLTQLKQLQTELQSLQADLQLVEQFTFLTENFVHNPNLGTVMGLLNALGLQNELPLNPFAVQALLSGYGGMGGLNGVVGKLSNLGNLVNGSFSADHLFDCTDSSFACQQAKTTAAANAGYKGIASQLYSDLTNHMTSLAGLRTTLLGASDPKMVADATAQIALEHTWVSNTAAQLQAVTAIAQAQQRVN
jgi:hypothetical protein